MAGFTYQWTYDNAGNITSWKRYAYTTGTVGTALETIPYAYTNSNWGDLLTAYNRKLFSYDTIGNLTSDGTWNYTWEHGRELGSMTKGSTSKKLKIPRDSLRVFRREFFCPTL